MTTFIQKETITRLIKDVKQLLKNPLTDQGIYYIHDEEDILKGYALIVGPTETPYFGGYYFFEFTFPVDYPYSPPKVKYCTNGNNIRFNPNLYACGKVCVSLLNTWRGEQWTSCQSISTVLLTLCTLLCKDPLLNEPGVNNNHPDMANYTEIIVYSNLNIAVCDILNKKEGVYLPFFNSFYPFIKENFMKNYEQLLDFANKKNNELNNTEVLLKTGFYGMQTIIDYNIVIERLKESKRLLA
jgi:ubiquitin-conjugating enzyme E2 Z